MKKIIFKGINVLLLTLFSNVVLAATSWTTGHYSNNEDRSQNLSVDEAYIIRVNVVGNVEQGYDGIYIYDENNSQVAVLTGNINENFLVNGKSIRARLTSDHSVTANGVRVSIEDADPVNPNGPRYLSRNCNTFPFQGVKESVSWYPLSIKTGYLHTKSARLKKITENPYYEVEWKDFRPNYGVEKIRRAYAGNTFNWDDRVSSETHYPHVYGRYWWWNPKNKTFDPVRKDFTTTCAGSAYDIDGLTSSRILGRSW